MKRVKMMLTAVAIFAVVGGALAFKAKSNTHYCTAALVNEQCPIDNLCPNNFGTGKATTTGTKYCFRAQPGSCLSTTTCTTSDFLTTDEGK
jgi:hypothetical protein